MLKEDGFHLFENCSLYLLLHLTCLTKLIFRKFWSQKTL